MKHLVLGGVRSGKSAFAQEQITACGKPVCYVATSQVWDDGMADRVRLHKDNRPSEWQLIEEPLALARVLHSLNSPDQAVIVECFTLWMTNLLCLEDETRLEDEKQALLKAVEVFEGDLILVSSEVGLGIMPMNALARRFGDEAGAMNQALAKLTDRVTFVAAGLPLPLKS
ncbi:MAG: bifunctional adenosylcobinamide kinase/adenosylcobinamide-phosphate guanylyltransferase [Gammaproteobacteria bacterium]|uniref:Bifunctional adenosylcobalamin biosynthesis protein n=1 Tax=Marinomonas polaris DSM 16579 TaxID=1122206 RepID=A0A1M5GQ44_9GAMM|nr:MULTISPECIES: bifunctional adenosylcobinamide kinase/adenosylcobinamide-phosphate guanylyltransferase [Marinomonas]MBU2414198.1 bifunctional adenosylcobinamide kinase/adenosylcobinamide-phosphate guanylyltransferase [Gammaproteobacteria bacterium]PJE53784.1 adenosylcobinamide kinase [Marinomonas sp. BSi20584]SHG05875.1 adenosylcobinamide kinase /adenosylcobinamide-phosphate guanylyltransferase [Marinomonas polaris DSM 16579]